MRTILPSLILAVGLFHAAPVGAGSSAERKLATLVTVDSFSPFFELGQGAVRIVVIVSPISSQAEATVAAITRLFASVPNNRLRAYLVLSPEVADVGSMEALELWRPVDDRRVIGFWDPRGITRDHWQPVVAMDSPKWDAVFVYDTDARFSGTGEGAPFWVQEPDTDEAGALDEAGLETLVRDLLESFEQRTRADTTAQETP